VNTRENTQIIVEQRRVSILVYGFSPSVQLNLVAGSSDSLSAPDNAVVFDLAAYLASVVAPTYRPVGLACRLERVELLAIGVPVGAMEAASGRGGLCIIYMIAIPKRRRPKPDFSHQILQLLDMVIARATSSRSQSDPIDNAGMLAKLLQGADERELRLRLGGAVDNLSDLASICLASNASETAVGRLKDNKRREPPGIDIPLFALAYLLVAGLKRNRGNLIGKLSPVSESWRGELVSSAAKVTNYRFVGDQVVLCRQFPRVKRTVIERLAGRETRSFAHDSCT